MSEEPCDDVPDYMSDDFLAKCVPEDVRPGLKRSHKSQREHDVQKKKDELEEIEKEKKRLRLPKNKSEAQNREEGLQKAIEPTNKGFEMLKKMGYKEGQSLGKSNTGRIEPIPIEVKTNRSGIGREEMVKRIHERKTIIREKRLEENAKRAMSQQLSTDEFRSQLSRQRKAKLIESDLYRSKKACCQLDQSKGYTDPVEIWFWPDTNESSENKEEEDECTNPDVKLNDTDDEGQQLVELPDDEYPGDNNGKAIDTNICSNNTYSEFSPEEQLQIINEYLREQYLYCLWCGITFSDCDDMSSACPGISREEHED